MACNFLQVWRRKLFLGILLLLLIFPPSFLVNPSPKEVFKQITELELKLPEKTIIAFRNDDISAFSDPEHEARFMKLFEEYGFPQTYGIVPMMAKSYMNPYDTEVQSVEANKEILEMLKKWKQEKKIEFALHGYTHRSYRSKREGYSEFEGLAYSTQLEMIQKGKMLLEEVLDTKINLFVPPFDRYDLNTILAVQSSGITILSGANYYNPIHSVVEAIKFPNVNIGIKELHAIANAPFDKGRILVILYHSWMIKENSEDWIMLKNALHNLSQNPHVEVLTLGDLAGGYHPLLSEFNGVGKLLYEYLMNIRAMIPVYISMPFKSILSKTDITFQDVLNYFSTGNYNSAKESFHIGKWGCTFYIYIGRLLYVGLALFTVIGVAISGMSFRTAAAISGLGVLGLEFVNFIHHRAYFGAAYYNSIMEVILRILIFVVALYGLSSVGILLTKKKEK